MALCSCEGGVVPAEEKDYEALLTAQLDQLRANLLQQHRAETDRLRKHNLKLRAELGLLHQGISADDDPLVTVADKDLANSPAPLLVELHPASDEKDRLTEPAHRWGLLVASLLDGEDSGWDPAPVSPPAASFTPAPLQMKASWAAGVHQMRQFRSYRTTLSSKNSTMRMQDAVQEEDSIFQRFVVGPRSKQQMIWSTVGAIWIVWDLITIPLGLFEDDDFIRLMSTVARVSFVYWFFDIPVHFFFGIEKRGKLEMRPSVLAKHYLRGWFWVDVMIVALDATLILVEALRDMGVNSTIFRSARFLRTLRLLRLLRLLRVAKLQQELMILANSFLSTHAFMVVKICVGLVMMLMINHVIACCWYGIGTFDMNGKNWIVQAEMESAPFGEAYAASMHWALTQFTPATQDIAASNAMERVFALLVILMAIGVFSSFITSITATMSSLRKARDDSNKTQMTLFRFFNQRNLSVGLYGKVEEALRLDGLASVRVKESEVPVLARMPERLRMQLHEEMYMSMVNVLGFWPDSAPDHQYFYSNLCHTCISEEVCTQQQDVFMPGTDCKHVLVIETGLMHYFARNQANVLTRNQEVQSEDVLCLPCLWADWQHRGRLTAGTGTSYYGKVNADEFALLARKFGGAFWVHLQIFGILLISEIENRDERSSINEHITDIQMSKDELQRMKSRAETYVAILQANDTGFSGGAESTPSLHSRIPLPVTASRSGVDSGRNSFRESLEERRMSRSYDSHIGTEHAKTDQVSVL